MKKFFFLIAVFLLNVQLHAGVNTDGDWQFWNFDRYYSYFNNQTGIFVEQEFRVGDHMSTLYYVHTLVGVFYDIFSWFRIMPAFRQNFFRHQAHEPWNTNYTPFLETLFTIPLGKSTFMNRTRFEYEIDPNERFFVLRNLFFLTLPFQFTSKDIQPFLSDEVFFTSREGFEQNRFQAGLVFPFHPQFRTQLYYMLRNFRPQGKWHYINALGLNLIFDF